MRYPLWSIRQRIKNRLPLLGADEWLTQGGGDERSSPVCCAALTFPSVEVQSGRQGDSWVGTDRVARNPPPLTVSTPDEGDATLFRGTNVTVGIQETITRITGFTEVKDARTYLAEVVGPEAPDNVIQCPFGARNRTRSRSKCQQGIRLARAISERMPRSRRSAGTRLAAGSRGRGQWSRRQRSGSMYACGTGARHNSDRTATR